MLVIASCCYMNDNPIMKNHGDAAHCLRAPFIKQKQEDPSTVARMMTILWTWMISLHHPSAETFIKAYTTTNTRTTINGLIPHCSNSPGWHIQNLLLLHFWNPKLQARMTAKFTWTMKHVPIRHQITKYYSRWHQTNCIQILILGHEHTCSWSKHHVQTCKGFAKMG